MNITKAFRLRLVGAKVAYYRSLRCMTQRELAAKICVNKNTLGRIERGKYNGNVSLSMLFDIADGLGIEVASLVNFSEADVKLEDMNTYIVIEEEEQEETDEDDDEAED